MESGPDSIRIGYGGVIALVDRCADVIDRYQQEREKGAFKEYEETLARLAKVPSRRRRGSWVRVPRF